MYGLSISQPWTWLIANGHKTIENRSWSTNYRGLVLLHAGKRIDTSLLSKNGYLNRYYSFAPHWQHVLPTMPDLEQDYEQGGMVGYATLTDVVTQSHDPWFRGPYGFVFTNCHPIPLIPCQGQLKLFEVPSEVEEKMLDILIKEIA